jgi:hypothetical protein
MPKRIAVPEIMLHIFNPLLLIVFAVLTVAVGVVYPLLGLALLLLVGGALAVKRTRVMLFELLQNNFILLLALSSFLTKRNFKFWKPVAESRNALTEAILREKKLI